MIREVCDGNGVIRGVFDGDGGIPEVFDDNGVIRGVFDGDGGIPGVFGAHPTNGAFTPNRRHPSYAICSQLKYLFIQYWTCSMLTHAFYTNVSMREIFWVSCPLSRAHVCAQTVCLCTRAKDFAGVGECV